MTTPEAILVDFFPHAVHYVGAKEDRWFVGLVQYPLLLALDSAGRVVERFGVTERARFRSRRRGRNCGRRTSRRPPLCRSCPRTPRRSPPIW